MGLFIAKGAGFFEDNAMVDLITIANMDTGYGENDISPSRKQVTYARTLGGVCQVRLDDLVNEISYSSPPDIIIFAVDGTFLLADGTPITSVAGVAIPVGDPINPTTSDIATIYDTSDCNGTAWWVDAEGGGTTSFPSAVILYHELAHCFHFVTGVATTEVLAETDENDLRDQTGVTHRDVNSHNGGCGGTPEPPCCVIASISTGSPYSKEVNHLRAVRDKMLRKSEVGNDFFNRLHYDYYAISPGVCSLMGNNPELTHIIKTFFVTPLIYALELIVHYTKTKGKNLASFQTNQFKEESFRKEYHLQMLQQIDFFLSIINDNKTREDYSNKLPGLLGEPRNLGVLYEHLKKGALDNPLIKWSLLDPLHVWIRGAIRMYSEKDEEANEEFLYTSISKWISFLPVTDVWKDLSRIQTEIELQNLENYIFDSHGKSNFANTLVSKYAAYKQTVEQWSLN